MKLPRLFRSSNSFFLQDPYTLKEKRNLVAALLEIKGYDEGQQKIYLEAYNYFSFHKEKFDGATMTEDLYDIDTLELDAMLHDFLYIKYNVAGNYKYIWLADKLMRCEMRRRGKSTINAGGRFVLLLVKTLIGYPLASYLFRGRRMSVEDKQAVDTIYTTLCTHAPRVWYKEFKGELTWSLIIILILLTLILT